MFTLSLLWLLSLACISTAQKKEAIPVIHVQKDSIDYAALFSDTSIYKVVSILQFKGEQQPASGQLFARQFWGGDYNPMAPYTMPTRNDTVALLSWLQNDRLLKDRQFKKFGLMRLNLRSNTLSVVSYSRQHNTNKTIKTINLFKVLVCTRQRIVLKEITHPEFNRTYFFVRERFE